MQSKHFTGISISDRRKGIRSECQAATPFVVWKEESGEKNGISLLCKAALAGKVVLL